MKILFLLLVFLSTLFSQTTMCYKENVQKPKIDNLLLLTSGKCQGKQSINSMKKDGWSVQYTQVSKTKTAYNHLVIFKKTTKQTTQPKASQPLMTRYTLPKSSFSANIRKIKISKASNDIAYINVGNLIIGQSGVIIHNDIDKSIIISNATVKETSKTNSILSLSKANDLPQEAIPTAGLKVQKGDTFILNHLYHSGLLIVPNFETSQKIKQLYPKQNFLNSDIFASYLKVAQLPTPKLVDMQKFCKTYDIGTIFIFANHTLYIIDVNSLKVLSKQHLSINDNTSQIPFFTKVTGIEKSFWDFGSVDMANYNQFYISLINHTNYQPKEKTIFKKLLEILP